MDFTQVHSAVSRKSYDRRVSWAQHTLLHFFEKPQNAGSSPTSDSSPQPQNEVNDENVHPQPKRRSSVRPRFSVAFSENGERSMELDDDEDEAVQLPAQFLNQFQNGTTPEDDGFSEEDEDDEDMEITEAIRLNIERKRSLSLGPRASLPGRRRSSIAPATMTSSQGQSENQIPPQRLQSSSLYPSLHEIEEDGREHEGDLTAQSASFVSESSVDGEPMDFIVPIDFPLGQPAPPDDAWLQLRAMTHAGVDVDEPPSSEQEDGGVFEQTHVNDDSDKELTDAMNRLQRARSSMGWPSEAIQDENAPQEDSFASTEDSFAGDDLDQTVNMTMTQFMNTDLINMDGGMDGGMEMTMEMSDVYGEPQVRQDDTAQLAASEPQPTTIEGRISPLVERVSNLSIQFSSPLRPPQPATIPQPFTFSAPRQSISASPAKPITPRKGPVFAPPKPQQPQRGTAAFALPSTPKSPKRPAPPLDGTPGTPGPSPAKKQAVGRLEAIKKPSFEKPQDATENRRASAVRRPSGYFAQRKSLGGANALQGNAGANSARVASPRKADQQALGKGRVRASMGSVPLSTAPVFSLNRRKDAASSATNSLYPDVEQIARENPPTPSQAAQDSQAVAIPSPTRSSSAPPSPRPEVFSTQARQRNLSVPLPSTSESLSPAPSTSVLVQGQDEDEIIQEPEQAMSSEPSPARQWRDGIDVADTEDEGVSIIHPTFCNVLFSIWVLAAVYLDRAILRNDRCPVYGRAHHAEASSVYHPPSTSEASWTSAFLSGLSGPGRGARYCAIGRVCYCYGCGCPSVGAVHCRCGRLNYLDRAEQEDMLGGRGGGTEGYSCLI